MKITLPSGVIIEGEPDEIEFALSRFAPEISPTGNENPEYQEAISQLTGRQRDTYDVLFNASDNGVHVSHVSRVLDITDQAAGQRCRDLIEMNLAERVERGVYRAVRG